MINLGYAGIDVIGEHRDWQNEDYQWFASLVNIINICIELQRSKREAQIERDYLQNLYRYMPLGYVRFRMIYDKTGTPVDYKVLDSNYAAEKIIGKSQADYVGRLASELEIEDMPEYLKFSPKYCRWSSMSKRRSVCWLPAGMFMSLCIRPLPRR